LSSLLRAPKLGMSDAETKDNLCGIVDSLAEVEVEEGDHQSAGIQGRSQPRQRESYAIYIYKVLKSVHPDMGISRRAMSIIDSFIQDIEARISQEAGRLCQFTSKGSLTSREIQTAVRLLLPTELQKHAVSSGVQALTRFTQPEQDDPAAVGVQAEDGPESPDTPTDAVDSLVHRY